jgi:glycolate oxidase iron-sulfur subunit
VVLAEKNLKIFAEVDVDVIVTDCSSCASFLKEYKKVFSDDPQKLELIEQTRSKIRDVVEFLYASQFGGDEDKQQEVMDSYHDSHSGTEAVQQVVPKDGKAVVTYHDPCHAVRGQGIKSESREILKSLANVEFREMAEADWCCGGAGSYALTHYDLSQKVLDRKIGNLKKTEADILVTSCPACMIQLAWGIRKHGLKTRVFHISEMTAYKEKVGV